MKRRNVGYHELSEKLTAMGSPETERNIANKISRGIHRCFLFAIPKGNWLHYFAIGGCLIASGAALSLPALGQVETKPKQDYPKSQTEKELVAVPDGSTLRAIFDELVKIYARGTAESDENWPGKLMLFS